MVDTSLSDAIKEAYASAPSDEVVLHTLELQHPAFVGLDGQSTPIRVVQNHVDIWANLEADVRFGAGETVQFISFPFEMTQPSISDGSVPESTLTIGNVSREIVDNIELAVESNEVITVVYRPYIWTAARDGSTEALSLLSQNDDPLRLSLVNIVAKTQSISGRIRFRDLANKRFPAQDYTPARFPRLVD